jgi:quinol-cytochrome oxidoreductase complex cytochrome b subunit
MWEERFNRAVDHLWSWLRWQLGVIQGRPGPGEVRRFRPSPATGALVLAAFAYQVASGGLLLLYYQPSVYPTLTMCGQASGVLSPGPAAWCSTYYIDHSVPMGSALLTSHLYGAYVLIFLMLVHLFRGFYAGAYKQPGGKFSWMAGTLLLLLVLAMGFTGYLLTYTQLSYNATQVSITLLQSLPLIGTPLANLVIGDGTPQGLLSRMFALHVVLLPVAIAVLLFLHKRSPLFPGVFGALVKWVLLYVGLLIGVASVWLWSLPPYAGSSGGAPVVTVPPWFFLWVFKLVDFDGVSPEAAMVFAVVVVLFLLFLPFLDRSRRTHPRDRPVFLFLANSMVGFFVVMTAWGDLAPGVPITPAEAALRLGPVLGANAIAVAVFYLRYRHRSEPVRRGGGSGGRPSPEAVPPGPLLKGPPTRFPKPDASVLRPVHLSVLGLIVSLFLLAFGLWLPCVLLLGAFLVSFADFSGSSAKPPSGPGSERVGPWLFPTVGFGAVAAFLVALILVVTV